MTNTFDKVGELTDAVPLTIGLSGCPATLARARVTFGGTAHPDNNQLYAVNEAEGVGIGILVMLTEQISILQTQKLMVLI